MAGRSQHHHRAAAGRPESIGPVLTRLRLARGLSQLQLAERLCGVAGTPTVSRHEVSRWEREERVPGGYWLGWLAVVLDASLEELEVAVTARRQPRGARRGRPDYRRLWQPPTTDELLAGLDRGGGHDLRELAHAWLAGPPELAGLPEPAAPPEPAGLPERMLAGLAARLTELRRMDDLVGGADLARLVDRELRAAAALLRSARVAGPRRAVLRLVAQLAQLAGWVHGDAGEPAAARRAYRVALRAAAAAADQPLAAHVLGCLSHHALAAGDPQEALLLARTARAGAAAGASGHTQALLLHRVALAAARCGERQAAHTALAAAEQAADRSRPEAEPPWLYWLDPPELSAMTGRCLLALGRPLRAAHRLATPRRTGPRTAALYATCLAHSYLELGEVELACRAALRAVRFAVRAGSVRATAGLRHLHPLLLQHRDVPAVRGYERLVAAVAGYLPAPGRSPPGTPEPGRGDPRARAGGGRRARPPPPGSVAE